MLYMEKIKVIEAGKLNTEGFKKVGKGLLIGFAGYALTEIANLTNIIDFGEYQPIAVVALAALVNLVRKFLFPYNSK